MSALSATYATRQKVLGYPVDLLHLADALKVVETAWQTEKGLHVATLNAEMVIAARENVDLDRIIRHAHLIVPDGAGVVWALSLSGHSIKRLPGIDLSSESLKSAAQKGIKIALLGGRKEVIESLLQSFPQKFPNLQIAFARDGYFDKGEEGSLVEEIKKSDARLILVALGVPKQEIFIDRYREQFPRSVLIGVGGSFDVWAGAARRAPVIFQQLNLEWLYRLIKEPWRLKRMSGSLPRFAVAVLFEQWRQKIEAMKNDR